MFLGSENFNDTLGNGIDTYLESVGAGYNATTSLGKMVWSTVFHAHPYSHPVIGWRSDIENISTERLREFYDTFYWPNNATLTVVGDIEPADILATIRKHFGAVPRSPHPIPEMTTVEPPQQGPRRVELRRAGEAGAVMMAWRNAPPQHEDTPALSVLDLILAYGKTSRLSRALVDTSLASYVGADNYMQRDPAMFALSVAMAPGASHEKVEQTLLTEIRRIQTEGVTTEEIRRVMGPCRAEQAYLRDGTSSAVGALNEYIGMGDWTLYATNIERIEKVTPADVQRVANTYLKPELGTTGWFIPETAK